MIYLKFGADTNVYGIGREKEIREIQKSYKCKSEAREMRPIRHLGTEEGYKIYEKLQASSGEETGMLNLCSTLWCM